MKRATLRTFALHPREPVLVARIFLFILFLFLSLRLFRIQDLVAKITPRGPAVPRRQTDPARIAYLCDRSFARLERFGYRRSCLKRCLVLYRFLRAEGVPVAINFGALWEGDTLKGHSWLTLDGALYRETQDKVDQFVYFFSLPPTEAGGARSKAVDGKGCKDLGQVHFD
jgi:hypothetical protein